MTPCAKCHRHVREDVCPFCGASCTHVPRIDLGRVARSTLLAVGAVALYDCSATPIYGFYCLDACAEITPYDASTNDDFQWNVDASTPQSDADAESDADAPSDAPADAWADADSASD